MQDIRSDKDCKGLYQHSSSAALLFLSPNANHLNTWLDSFLLFKIYLKKRNLFEHNTNRNSYTDR